MYVAGGWRRVSWTPVLQHQHTAACAPSNDRAMLHSMRKRQSKPIRWALPSLTAWDLHKQMNCVPRPPRRGMSMGSRADARTNRKERINHAIITETHHLSAYLSIQSLSRCGDFLISPPALRYLARSQRPVRRAQRSCLPVCFHPHQLFQAPLRPCSLYHGPD